MDRATGIGGVFFRARDPKTLQEWYATNLGLQLDPTGSVVLEWRERTDATRVASTVWAPFPDDTDYFGPSGQSVMINYRVRNLDTMRSQLRAAGADVDERVEEMEFGRFGWATDPEGNRLELWEPAEGW